MSLRDMMRRHISGWMSLDGPESDVVLSSRIRLARNLRGCKFPPRSTDAENKDVLAKVEQVVVQLIESRTPLFKDGRWVRISELSPIERQVLVERHLVSPQYVQEVHARAVFISADETTSVMVNEEDHLRIQTMNAGLRLTDSLSLASQVDDILEDSLDYDTPRGLATSLPVQQMSGPV